MGDTITDAARPAAEALAGYRTVTPMVFCGIYPADGADYDALKDAVLVNGATSFMIGLSMAFAAYLSMAQIPAMMGEWLLSVSSSPVVTLMIINVFLLIIGCFVDNIAAVIILTPILLPVVTQLGIDPVHFGLIMTVNLAVGFITPPYGINLFVGSAVSGESIEDISREVMPLIAVMILCLLLFTYVPQTSMALVEMFRHH